MSIDFISTYIGHHKDKKVIYFLGKKADLKSLLATFSINRFDECLLFVENEEIKSKIDLSKLHNAKLATAEEIKKSAGFSYVFDNFVPSFDFKFNTKKLIGSYSKGVDTYKIWQQARSFVDEIVLASYCDEVRSNVLEWKKNPETDIELSVIMPTYNVEKYLPKCIESLIQWDVPYVEYLFVDDGSKDNSARVVLEYAKKDPRIKLLSKENGGCASARQYGIDNSLGRYLGFIDPDDFIDPTMFEKLHSKAMIGSYEVAFAGYNEYYEDTGSFKKIEDLTGLPYSLGTADRKDIDRLISDLRIAIWRGIYSRELLNRSNIHFYTQLKRFDDLPFKTEVYSKAMSVISVDEPLYYYRLGRVGQDVSATDERLYVHFEIFSLLDKFFEKCGANQKNRYYKVKVQTHYWATTVIKSELKKEYIEKAATDLQIANTRKVWRELLLKYYKKKEVNLFLKYLK